MAEFLRLRLNGERFNNGRIPLDMLGDLSVIGEMVVAVAKWRYLEAHPERERSPRGFAEKASFSLIDVDEGSAIPVIEMESHPAPLPGMFGEYEQYFVEARDSIGNAIAAAERAESTATILPEQYLGFFDRFGRGLREGESIEFPTSIGGRPARLTKESRRRLVLASRIKEITQEVQLRCYIPEVDQDRMTFESLLPGGHKVTSLIHEHHLEVIMQVFNSYKDQGRALIQGIGKYDQQERLLSFVSIEDIVLLDELDIPSRLDELRALKDGWLDGEGRAPRPDFLEWLSEKFDLLYPDDLPLPYIYPIISGGVQAEWSLPPNEASLAVDPVDCKAEWHVLHLDTAAEDIGKLDLADDSGWIQLTQLIRSFSASQK